MQKVCTILFLLNAPEGVAFCERGSFIRDCFSTHVEASYQLVERVENGMQFPIVCVTGILPCA